MFPRTRIGDVSVSRMIIGTNWFLGFSHASAAKDRQIRKMMTPARIADILEVFLNEGVDTIIGPFGATDGVFSSLASTMREAVREAEQRAGRGCIVIATPTIDVGEGPGALANVEKTLDAEAVAGAAICMPHQFCTDQLVDMRARRITNMDVYCRMIRERGMTPGLSTHMPETIVYADGTGLDVETYLAVYNAVGFLMHLEAEWVRRIIWNAKHPVVTIKPLAAGRLTPLVGLAFSWATVRDVDMVAVGTSSPDEAREVVEISLSILERRLEDIELQRTRSKATVTPPAEGGTQG